MTETALVTKALKWLRAKGGLWEKRHQTAYTTPGASDVTGVYRGIPIAIEFKAPGRYARLEFKHLTAAQQKFQIDWEEAGGYAYFTDSFEGVQAIMKRVDERNGWAT